MVAVTNVQAVTNDSGTRLSGLIGGEELWYQFPPNVRIEARGEPFLAFALLLGMARGEDVTFESNAPLSPMLLAKIEHIQSLLQLWNPRFTKIAVHARALAAPPLNEGVLSPYSGGVDGSYTFLRHKDEVTHLLTVNSFDTYGGDVGLDEQQQRMESVASAFGKGSIAVESNAHKFNDDHNMKWIFAHGPFLCLLTASLGFKRVLIASSYTYRELLPWGSHVLLDPMWSTEACEIVHDAAEVRRSAKTEALAADPTLLSHLQVCWFNKTTNCGHCSKCARTQIVLNMLGVEQSIFPPATSPELVGRLELKDDHLAAFVWDIMEMAVARGELEIAELLKRKLNRYGIRRDYRRWKRGVKIWIRMHTVRDQLDRVLGRGRRKAGPVRVQLADPDPVFD